MTTRTRLLTCLSFTALAILACSREPSTDNTASPPGASSLPGTVEPTAPAPQPPGSETYPAVETEKEYSLSIEPVELPNGDVRIEIVTDIPGVIEVMAGLSLHGQADDDTWIGKNERVRIADGRGEVTFSTGDLPTGRYDAEASFYPRWGFQDSISRATGVSKDLTASADLILSGSGESASEAQFKENGQRWVMENVAMGDPWKPSDWIDRFGTYEELPLHRGNPEILKAYYFSRIDMTLIVNILKKEITVWRLGKAHG